MNENTDNHNTKTRPNTAKPITNGVHSVVMDEDKVVTAYFRPWVPVTTYGIGGAIYPVMTYSHLVDYGMPVPEYIGPSGGDPWEDWEYELRAKVLVAAEGEEEGAEVTFTTEGCSYVSEWDGDGPALTVYPNESYEVNGTLEYTSSAGRAILETSPEGKGEILSDPEIIEGEPATAWQYELTAVPSECYSFSQWDDGSTDPVKYINTYSCFGSDVTFTAYFVFDGCFLSTFVDPPGGGLLEADSYGPFDCEDSATLTVTPSPGWRFTGLTSATGGTWSPGVRTSDLLFPEADSMPFTWWILGGEWEVATIPCSYGDSGSGTLVKTGTTSLGLVYTPQTQGNASYEFIAKMTGDTFTGPVGMFLRYVDEDNYVELQLWPDRLALRERVNGAFTTPDPLAETTAFPTILGQNYDFQVHCIDDTVEVWRRTAYSGDPFVRALSVSGLTVLTSLNFRIQVPATEPFRIQEVYIRPHTDTFTMGVFGDQEVTAHFAEEFQLTVQVQGAGQVEVFNTDRNYIEVPSVGNGGQVYSLPDGTALECTPLPDATACFEYWVINGSPQGEQVPLVLSQPQPEHCPVFLVSAVSCTHCPIPPFGREFKKAWQVYHPMRIGWAWRQWYATPSHRLMSLTGVSLGRPLSSRHCLRFARQPSRYATAASVFNCLCCRRSSRAASSLRSRSACISAWRPSSMSWGVT